MNNKFETAFGIRPNALPLRPSGHIVCGNACRLDWETVCPHAEEEEVYVMGNPPYLGARLQSKDQKEDMQYAMQQNLAYNNLDYIATWFYKGSLYIKDSKSKLAFVTTNSICQGEQVALLWKYLQSITIEIYFAYSSFRWSNNAKNNAGVTCTIIGLRFVCSKNSPKYLFKDDEKRSVPNINPYLYAGTNVIVDKQNDSISHFPTIAFGSMPNDGGYLLIDEHEKEKLIDENTMSSKIIHRILGSQEFIRD